MSDLAEKSRSLNADDDRLLALIKSGSPAAFETLYDRYSERALRVAGSICPDLGSAEEAVQDAFLSIWRNSDAYRPQDAGAAAWVLTLVRYRAIDLARGYTRRSSHRADEAKLDKHEGSRDVAEEALSRSGASELRDMLSKLPDLQREVITLAFYGELSHNEISAHLDLPPGTVKGRMRLGLEKLRAQL